MDSGDINILLQLNSDLRMPEKKSVPAQAKTACDASKFFTK
jgi:hypothetical protein